MPGKPVKHSGRVIHRIQRLGDMLQRLLRRTEHFMGIGHRLRHPGRSRGKENLGETFARNCAERCLNGHAVHRSQQIVKPYPAMILSAYRDDVLVRKIKRFEGRRIGIPILGKNHARFG